MGRRVRLLAFEGDERTVTLSDAAGMPLTRTSTRVSMAADRIVDGNRCMDHLR